MAMPAFSARHSAGLSISARAIALALVTTAFAGAVLIVLLRRMMGALAQPLGAGTLVTTLLAALFTALAWRLLWRGLRPVSKVQLWLPTLLIALLAAALWLPGTPLAVLAGVIALDAGVAAAFYWGQVDRLPWNRWRTRWSAAAAPSSPVATPRIPVLPHGVTQQFTRRRLDDGSELVEGVLRTALVAGQRLEYCHVAFCPPLAGIAQVSCQQLAGLSARIKVAQVLPQGARIEVRLSDIAAHGVEIIIGLSAHCLPGTPLASPPAANPRVGQQA